MAQEDLTKFPFFAFQLSTVPDDEAESGEVKIPVMRLWLSEDRFYDLNVDNIIDAVDIEKGKTKKAANVEIFNNDEYRSMIVVFNKKTRLYDYYISHEYETIEDKTDIEYKNSISIVDMAFYITEFMNEYNDWLHSQFDENGKNINAK